MRTIRILSSLGVILLAGAVGLLASSPQPADDPPAAPAVSTAEGGTTSAVGAPLPRTEEAKTATATGESCTEEATAPDDGAAFTEDRLELGTDGALRSGKKLCRAWICLYQDYKCFNIGGHCPNCQYGNCVVTPCNDFAPDCQ